jgi:hypothetical protein
VPGLLVASEDSEVFDLNMRQIHVVSSTI